MTKFSILFITFLQVTHKPTVSVEFVSCFNKILDKVSIGFTSLKNNIKSQKSLFMFRSEEKKIGRDQSQVKKKSNQEIIIKNRK